MSLMKMLGVAYTHTVVLRPLFDSRVPLSETSPAGRLVEHCESLGGSVHTFGPPATSCPASHMHDFVCPCRVCTALATHTPHSQLHEEVLSALCHMCISALRIQY